jgi:CRISPR-associated endoribonuclease Cas6
LRPLAFPRGMAGNAFRGAFGHVASEALFTPKSSGRLLKKGLSLPLAHARGSVTPSTSARTFPSRGREGAVRSIFQQPASGPSGLADPPRPFVLRAAHLDGSAVEPGERFYVDVNLFDQRSEVLEEMLDAFRRLWPDRVELLPVAAPVIRTLELCAPERVEAGRVHFRTPTDLKGSLFTRARDRVSTLSTLYGEGTPDIDFKGMSERAGLIRVVKSQIQHHQTARRSSRTGQTHGIGGFTGTIEYEGPLTEFVPFLKAAFWTGVGRHTVWGNGVIEFVAG